MKKNPANYDPHMKNGYIPAPYVLEDGEQINDFYLEPVLFRNENGPTIGVTTCGVIVKDGLFFKDMDNDGVLSPYEDWRNTDEVRAEDMVIQEQASPGTNPFHGFRIIVPSKLPRQHSHHKFRIFPQFFQYGLRRGKLRCQSCNPYCRQSKSKRGSATQPAPILLPALQCHSPISFADGR